MNLRKYKFLWCLCTFVFSVFVNITAEEQEIINIKDYFPTQDDAYWSYSYNYGKDIVTNMYPNTKLNDDYFAEVYLSVEIYGASDRILAKIYCLDNNKIVALGQKDITRSYYDIFGKYYYYQAPFPIVLAPPDSKGEYMDNGNICHYVTSIATCKYDDKIFKDCILVEEKTMLNNKPIRTKRRYYAKGVGLVCVTLVNDEGVEKVFMKLEISSLLK